MKDDTEIDDSFYSRQRYVFGDDAMIKLNYSSVLIVGLGGVGIEIAKNVILSGVQRVAIKDNKIATTYDLGNNFYLKPENVDCNKMRAEICYPKLKELNYHVKLELDLENELNFDKLNEFECIVLTECSFELIASVDRYCSERSSPIKVIVADVFGLLGCVFCNFGAKFDILDKTGEDPAELFVADITRGSPGVVTLMDDQNVGSLHDGSTVTFREVQGMIQLNNSRHRIKVLTAYSFEIGDTSDYDDYISGGICTEVILPVTESHVTFEQSAYSFKSLVTLNDFNPGLDISSHVAYLALHKCLREDKERKLNGFSDGQIDEFLETCRQIYSEIEPKKDIDLDFDYLKIIANTFHGQLVPLCSFIGGFAAQEVLKAVTWKFTPLTQWMYLSFTEFYNVVSPPFRYAINERYDAFTICAGATTLKRLNELKLFLVGCGAIGCELLKIFALMGVSCGSENGEIVVTDNDLIEKSNLNRQFLFKDRHVRMAKSEVGAASVREINSEINVKPLQSKVCPESEDIFTEEFFESRDIIVNALDNIEARIYVDQRCVSAEKPLLDSGTMGTKASVQVVLPHLTENYGNSRDPEDGGVPMCTLKSFPASINHTIIWARNKFQSLFVEKANKFNSFWIENGSPEVVLEKIRQTNSFLPNIVQTLEIYLSQPSTLSDCVRIARLKFEKYFNHKAKQLLHVFPLDHRVDNGSLFWQLPKRPPKPVEYDGSTYENHLMFIISCAKLLAMENNIPDESSINADFVAETLSKVDIPHFIPKNKKIATEDQDLQSNEIANSNNESVNIDWCITTLEQMISETVAAKPKICIHFEKDDDLHIDFVTATSNLRAIMYGLEPADRYVTKKIAGKIIPAISTTTACVAGLVSLELIKIALKIVDLSKYRNCYLNLAFPLMLFSEPLPVEKLKAGDDYISVWDKCKIYGNAGFKLIDLINQLNEKYSGVVTMVAEGKKAYYLPPMIVNKIQMKLIELVENKNSKKFVDFVVSMETSDGENTIECPTVRYYF